MSQHIYQEAFKNFSSPNTTDGSYLGINNAVKKQEEYMHNKVLEEIEAANVRLKAAKVKVRITSKGKALQLRATLPLKPDDTGNLGKQFKQYQISLGIPASLEGVITAEEEAYELGRLIARKTFVWSEKYLGKTAIKKVLTFQDIYDGFEDEYFKTRKKTLKSEGTLFNYKRVFKKRFDLSQPATLKNFERFIQLPDSESVRRELIKISTLACKLFGIKANFNHLKTKYQSQYRDIPDDEAIIINFNKYTSYQHQSDKLCKRFRNLWKFYRLVYGLIATYGLRPREVFNKPDIDWFLSEANTSNTFKVHADNKTGYREVLPFVPEWVDLFELKDTETLSKLKLRTADLNSFKQLNAICNMNSAWFVRVGVEFQPYDLRHACAIRAHLQGIPVKAAADNLGHSVDMHTKVYQRWFGLENRKRAMSNALHKLDENEILNIRINKLELENDLLKTEVARLKSQLDKSVI